MSTRTTVGKKDGLTRIISLALAIICVITLYSPWVQIGIRKNNGGMLELNNLLGYLSGSGLTDILGEAFYNEAYYYSNGEASEKKIRSDLNSAKKASRNIVSALKDSKLSPVETASSCTNALKVNRFFSKYDSTEPLEDVKAWVVLAAIFMWGLVLAFIGLSLHFAFCVVTGRKQNHIPMMCVYYAIFAIYLILTVVVNIKVKEVLDNGFVMGFLNLKSTSVMHIRFAPIFVGLLLAAYSVFLKRNPVTAETTRLEWDGKKLSGVFDDFTNKTKSLVSNVNLDKYAWTCTCGSINSSKNAFCPKCGARKPETVVKTERTWTCACGSVNIEKNAFCPKCGKKKPEAELPKKYYCIKCGKPVAEGETLCEKCSSPAGGGFSTPSDWDL